MRNRPAGHGTASRNTDFNKRKESTEPVRKLQAPSLGERFAVGYYFAATFNPNAVCPRITTITDHVLGAEAFGLETLQIFRATLREAAEGLDGQIHMRVTSLSLGDAS